MKKKLLIICTVILFCIMLAFSFSVINRETATYKFDNTALVGHAHSKNALPDPIKTVQGGAKQNGASQSNPHLSLEDRLAGELKKYYSDTINHKSTQAILLKVKDYVMSLFPEDGTKRFYRILKMAFPDLADEIMITLNKLEEYNRWLKENQIRLSEMNELERKGTIWEKRQALFGAEAEEIWSDEVFAYEERQQDMKETIRLLNESYDTTIEEKLDIYIEALNETYENTPEAYFLENRGLLSKVFFGIESVQKELTEMPTDQRQMEINDIRREMGFTQPQIEEHEKLDIYRNKRWETGLNYMKERDALASRYSGADLEEKLKPLREKYFKHEAITIEREENDGFFRYERPRVYGRN